MSSTRTTGWIPEEALRCPPVEREATSALVHVAAELLRQGPKLAGPGIALSRASEDLDAVLLGYRVEAALVRRALRLPATARRDEVLRAREQRGEA